jgi:hypothetical protein
MRFWLYRVMDGRNRELRKRLGELESLA